MRSLLATVAASVCLLLGIGGDANGQVVFSAPFVGVGNVCGTTVIRDNGFLGLGAFPRTAVVSNCGGGAFFSPRVFQRQVFSPGFNAGVFAQRPVVFSRPCGVGANFFRPQFARPRFIGSFGGCRF